MVMKRYFTFPKAPGHLVSHPGYLLWGWGSYPSAEMQSAFSTAPVEQAAKEIDKQADKKEKTKRSRLFWNFQVLFWTGFMWDGFCSVDEGKINSFITRRVCVCVGGGSL